MGKKLYIRAGWVIDGTGGPLLEKQLLTIADGIFESVVDDPGENGPDSSLVIDLSHAILLPPLVDSHVHLFMSGTTDRAARERQLVAGYKEQAATISQHLHYLFSHGVLAVRDCGDRGNFVPRYIADGLENREMIISAAGRSYHKKNRYGSLIAEVVEEDESLTEAFNKSLSENKTTRPSNVYSFVKVVNSGLNSLKEYGKETAPQFSLDELAALVKSAGQSGKKVMAHANGHEPVRIAVEAGCHSIEHGFFMGEDNLKRMADNGTWWVPTVFTMKGYGQNFQYISAKSDPKVIEKNVNHQLEQLARARELGVRIALGTDSGSLGVLHGESMVEEMKLYKKAGFTLSELMRCATKNGAELMGLDDFGEITEGKRATFLTARGAPGQLPRKLSYLEGIYVDGAPSRNYRKNPYKHTG